MSSGIVLLWHSEMNTIFHQIYEKEIYSYVYYEDFDIEVI